MKNIKMNNIKLTSALEYQRFGLSIIPVANDKKSLIAWQKYQHKKADKEKINSWWAQWPDANIGIVTGIISGLAVIDIDTEEGHKEIQKYIPDSITMPVVNTPSGGKHLYFSCPDEKLTNNAKVIPGCDLRANGGYVLAPPSHNGAGGRYTWQTGLSISQASISALPEAYINYINNNSLYKRKKDPCSLSSTKSKNVHKMFSQGSRDNDIFHAANCLIKGGMHREKTLQVIEILAKNCFPPFPESEIPIKIKSALDRSQRRQRNLSQEVREFVESTNGHFTSTEVHKFLDVSGKHEKKNISEILRRLCDDEAIERYGKRNGNFRKIDGTAEDIDFLNANVRSVNITLPFGLHRLVDIYPRNIIAVAGAPDSGKTAFLLNIVEMNMHRHNIYYFSSEMAEQEMRLRLSKFNRELTEWRFKPKERSSNFADVIRPDDINIIDFMEIHDEFWKVGSMLKEIYDKLNKGIAIVAIQKDKHKEYGLGASRGLEKPRLYLTLNPGEAKIEKAKNWADPKVNPNGLMLNFKLYQGSKFSIVKNWHK